MDEDRLYTRYRELQAYVGWTDADAERIVAAAPILEPCLIDLVDDFYAEIERHPKARKVITGGQQQIDRLKGTLVQWLRELLAGRYDASLRGPALASRLATRRDRPGAGLHQRGLVATAHRAGAQPSHGMAGRADGPEGNRPRFQQAARPRSGDHRRRLSERVRGATSTERATGDARAGCRRCGTRASQSAQRDQDIGLLPPQRSQSDTRKDRSSTCDASSATSSCPTM